MSLEATKHIGMRYASVVAVGIGRNHLVMGFQQILDSVSVPYNHIEGQNMRCEGLG